MVSTGSGLKRRRAKEKNTRNEERPVVDTGLSVFKPWEKKNRHSIVRSTVSIRLALKGIATSLELHFHKKGLCTKSTAR